MRVRSYVRVRVYDSISPLGTLTLQQVEKGESILMQIYQTLKHSENNPTPEQLTEIRALSKVTCFDGYSKSPRQLCSLR
jgi:hypothetical protein